MNDLNCYLDASSAKFPSEIINTVGASVQTYTAELDITDFDFFLLALYGDASCEIHTAIYSRFYHLYSHVNVKICDLGIIKSGQATKDTLYALKYVIESIRSVTVKPIIILGQRFNEFSSLFGNLCTDNSQTTFITSSVTPDIVEYNRNYEGDVNAIGVQLYLTNPDSARDFTNYQGEIVRLGTLIDHVQKAEIFLRDSSSVVIDSCSLENSITFSSSKGSANGLSYHSFCQLAYYAGRSQYSDFLFLDINIDESVADCNLLSDLFSQVIWHYMIGRSQTLVLDTSSKSLKQYHLSNIHSEIEFCFIEDTAKATWWIKLVLGDETYFLASSRDEYMSTLNGDVNSRFLRKLYK